MGGSQSSTSRNGACNNYSWDPYSAIRKGTSNMDIGVNVGVVNVTKHTDNYNPKTDAYRSCENCGKHKNYHGK